MKTSHHNDSTSLQFTDSARTGRRLWALALSICSAGISLPVVGSEHVNLVRTPDGGIQPQAVVDSKGVVHLIYYKGDARGGDLFYVRQEPGKETFPRPIQVNSQLKSAMAAGTIRGAQLAVGKNGRVHVAWNGRAPSSHATSNHVHAPVAYSADSHESKGHESTTHASEGHEHNGHSSGGHAAGTSEQPAWMKAPMLYTRLNDT